ncbi:hypothetical protein Dimus_011935 [Dionaea muscipula]
MYLKLFSSNFASSCVSKLLPKMSKYQPFHPTSRILCIATVKTYVVMLHTHIVPHHFLQHTYPFCTFHVDVTELDQRNFGRLQINKVDVESGAANCTEISRQSSQHTKCLDTSSNLNLERLFCICITSEVEYLFMPTKQVLIEGRR